MFLKLTNSKGSKFLINTSFIVEICDYDGDDENVNSVLLTPFKDRMYPVEEDKDEIALLIKENEN